MFIETIEDGEDGETYLVRTLGGLVIRTLQRPALPPPHRRITRFALLARFTDAEAIAIDLASIGATVEAAGMRRYLSMVDAAEFIDLDMTETRDGVEALETFGLLDVGRAAEILDNEIQQQELP